MFSHYNNNEIPAIFLHQKKNKLIPSLQKSDEPYLVNERGASSNTVKSYRDTFVQFIGYLTDVQKIKINKITLSIITKESVIAFLDWLQETKKCSNATRNSRLAALHSFFRYVQFHHPDHLFEYQRIFSIKVKKHKKESINCLSVDGIRLLLNQPDMTSKKGRREASRLYTHPHDTVTESKRICIFTKNLPGVQNNIYL